MKKITAKDNPEIKKVMKLKQQRRFRHVNRLFLIEGKTMLEEAINSSSRLEQIFLDETKLGSWTGLIAANPDLNWILVSSSLIKYMSATDAPSGIIAVVAMSEYDWSAFIRGQHLLLLLDAIADPGNMGTIIRTAWALGVDGILLLPDCVDVYSPKVVRASMGGIFNMPLCPVDLAAVEQLCVEGYRFIMASAQGEQSVYNADFLGSVLVGIGNEVHGISKDLMKIGGYQVKIPINPTVDSLNAAVACAIIMAEAWKQRRVVP